MCVFFFVFESVVNVSSAPNFFVWIAFENCFGRVLYIVVALSLPSFMCFYSLIFMRTHFRRVVALKKVSQPEVQPGSQIELSDTHKMCCTMPT